MIGIGNYIVTPGLAGDGLAGVGGTCGLQFPFNRAKREACQAKHLVKKEERQERREERRSARAERRAGAGAGAGGAAAGGIPWPIIAVGGVALIGVIWFLKRRKAAP